MPLVAQLFIYGFAAMMLVGAIYVMRIAVNLARSEGRRVTFAELLLGLIGGYIGGMALLFMLLQDLAGWSHSRAMEVMDILAIPLVAAVIWFLWLVRRAIDEAGDKNDS